MGKLLLAWLALWPAFVLMGLAEIGRQANVEHLFSFVGWMLRNQTLHLWVGFCVWFVTAGPLLRWARKTWHWALLGVWGGIVLLLTTALIHYFAIAGVPLGADLFAYSGQEIKTTLAGADIGFFATEWWAWVAACAVYGLELFYLARRTSLAISTRWTTAALLVSLLGAAFAPNAWTTTTPTLTQNKLNFFVSDAAQHLWAGVGLGQTHRAASSAYPFARAEKTPDTLSPWLHLNPKQPPNILIIIVEGLGRDFSGPHARLGSFTPFLDELADRSLYWENFLSTQGRTFAVLPSVLGSLPFASYGTRQVAHDSLLSVLKTQGYALNYFSGSNLAFDHQGDYLASEGVSTLYSEADFSNPQKKANEWGYPDRDLLDFMAEKLAHAPTAPSLSIVQTMSMHTPFLFPEIEAYRKKVDARLDQLRVPGDQRAAYQSQRDIFASVLYTDDALRQFFARMVQTPQWRNTVVVITGDHRLPELPMDTRLERYHVPLIVASEMLVAPQKIRAISSHFDIAPSLLAMLSQQYGYETPATVSWLGTGLDTSTTFRNLHALALKQTKASLNDYVSGLFYLGQDQLYQITDNLVPAPITDDATLARLRAEFNTFEAGLATLEHAQRLTPVADANLRVRYQAEQRTLEPLGPVAQLSGVVVSDTRLTLLSKDELQVQAVFANQDAKPSRVFVPLVVVSDAQGQQVAEASGKAVQLAKSETQTLTVNLKLAAQRDAKAAYFVSFIVSDPDTGKSIGHGQYHVAWQK